jgi:hypothetical protein
MQHVLRDVQWQGVAAAGGLSRREAARRDPQVLGVKRGRP